MPKNELVGEKSRARGEMGDCNADKLHPPSKKDSVNASKIGRRALSSAAAGMVIEVVVEPVVVTAPNESVWA